MAKRLQPDTAFQEEAKGKYDDIIEEAAKVISSSGNYCPYEQQGRPVPHSIRSTVMQSQSGT